MTRKPQQVFFLSHAFVDFCHYFLSASGIQKNVTCLYHIHTFYIYVNMPGRIGLHNY